MSGCDGEKTVPEKKRGKVFVALVHYPVYNKNRDVVVTALTNLDVHDIARAAKTYGVEAFYIVTPSESQHRLLRRILNHWASGYGGEYNPTRKVALELVNASYTLEDVINEIAENTGTRPMVVLTSARGRQKTISFRELGSKVVDGADTLLVFGTGWGLAEEIYEDADFLLEPIYGVGEYNHLSVRSAVSIVLDRLFGR